MTLSGVYGFWKYATKNDKVANAKKRYLEMFYELGFKKSVSIYNLYILIDFVHKVLHFAANLYFC